MKYAVTLGSALQNAAHANPVVTVVPANHGLTAQVFGRRADWADRQTWTMTEHVEQNGAGWLVEQYSFAINWNHSTWGLALGQPQQPVQVVPYNANATNQRWYVLRQKPEPVGSIAGAVALASAASPKGPVCLDLFNFQTADGSPVYAWEYQQNSDKNTNQFWGRGSVGEATGDGPQVRRITEMLLDAARTNPALRGNLLSDPAAVFAAAGYPIQIEDYRAFNRFFLEYKPLQALLAHEGPLAAFAGWPCVVCKIGFLSLAIAVTAVGAGALTLLSPTAPIVVAVAAAAGTTAPVALAWIVGLSSAVAFTVDFVLASMCEWIGACS